MPNYLRRALWLSLPFNLGAALAFLLPWLPPAQMVGLPTDAPLIYRALVALFVATFGLAYGWMAMQPQIQRPMLWFSVAGKSSVFTLATVFAVLGLVPMTLIIPAAGDGIFALIFIHALRRG